MSPSTSRIWRLTFSALLTSFVLLGFPADAQANTRLIRDLNYVGDDNKRHTLDLVLPTTDTKEPLPIIVFIHGGGWHQGRKEHGRGFLPNFVKSGEFAAASINYRLSQEAIWPAQIHDCKAAIRWIRGNAAKYNIDPKRIAVSGMSAGGHLAAMVGSTGHCKTLEGTLGKHLDQSSEVQCVINLFGPAHFVSLDDKQLPLKTTPPNSAVSRLLGPDPERLIPQARSASPTTHIDPKDPPVFIAHGDKDPLVPYQQSVNYEQQLDKARVPCTLVMVQGAAHGFRSPEVNRRILAFLQNHLYGTQLEIANTPVPLGR